MSASQGRAVFKNQTFNGNKGLCEFTVRLKPLASEGHVPCRATAVGSSAGPPAPQLSCRGVTLEKVSVGLGVGLYIWFG